MMGMSTEIRHRLRLDASAPLAQDKIRSHQIVNRASQVIIVKHVLPTKTSVSRAAMTTILISEKVFACCAPKKIAKSRDTRWE